MSPDKLSSQDSPADLLALDAVALAAAVAGREISCAELMSATLDRIDALNPRFNAIVALRERGALMAEAQAKDAESACGASPAAARFSARGERPRTGQGPALHQGHADPQKFPPRRRQPDGGAHARGRRHFYRQDQYPEFGLGSHTYNPVYGPPIMPMTRPNPAAVPAGAPPSSLALRMLPSPMAAIMAAAFAIPPAGTMCSASAPARA